MKHNNRDKNNKIRRIKEFQIGLLSFFIAVISVVFVRLITFQTYTTTDDAFLMQTIGGYFNGEPMIWAPFLGNVLTRFIALLYKVLGFRHIYVYFQLFLIVICIAIINFCIITALPDRKKMILGGALLSLLVDSSISWIFVRMHFECVASLLGTAAIALILSSDLSIKNHLGRWLIIALLFGLCTSYSDGASLSLMAYSICAVFFVLLIAILVHRRDAKKVISNVLVFLVVFAGIYMSTIYMIKFERNRLCGKEYTQWNFYRINYWDYGSISYEDNPDLYDDVDWSEDFYSLTRKMYFMDPRFSSDNLSEIVDSFDRFDLFEEDRSFHDALLTGKKLFDSSPEAKGLIILMVGLLLATPFFAVKKREAVIILISNISCFMLSAFFCFYLAFRGRFPLRAFTTIAFPCVVIMSYFVLRMARIRHMEYSGVRSVGEKRKTGRKKILHVAGSVFGTVIVVSSFTVSESNILKDLTNKKSEAYYLGERTKERSLYNYVSTHKENIYVYDWSCVATYDPYPIVGSGDLSNLFCWGGARLYAYPYEKQLELNGLSQLQSEDFVENNIFFISNNSNNASLLHRFLHDEYGIDICIVVDEFDPGFVVYKFVEDEQQLDAFLSEHTAVDVLILSE